MPNEYATVEKIREVMTDKELIKALNEDPANEKSVNLDRLKFYVELANQNIDDALRGRYELPLTKQDPVLENIALKIAKYEIIMRKKDGTPPEGLETAYNDAMSRLNSYRIGELTLEAKASPKKSSVVTIRTKPGRMSALIGRW